MKTNAFFLFRMVPVAVLAILLAGGVGLAQVAEQEDVPWISKLKKDFGPVEIVPFFSVGIESHSNVYLTTEDTPNDSPIRDVSGIILAIDPGVRISFHPKLRNIKLDVNYIPQLKLFPDAPGIVLVPGASPPYSPTGHKPDQFYVNHHFNFNAGVPVGERFLIFAVGGNFDQPDVAATNTSLRDMSFYAGPRFFLPNNLSARLQYKRRFFHDPVVLLTQSGGQWVEVEDTKSPFGTFTENQFELDADWQPSARLRAGVVGRCNQRGFWGVRETPFTTIQEPWDINGDGVPDSVKNYDQWFAGGSADFLLRPNMSAGGEVGYIKRDLEQRQFGADTYDSIVGRVSFSTALTRDNWTRLQAFAEHTLTDTYREMDGFENNVFTDPQLGAFTILPDDFTMAYSTRGVVDLVRLVNRRGDQVLFGFSYQRDELRDTLNASVNLFQNPAIGKGLTLDEISARLVELGLYNVPSAIPERTQEMYLLTLGYRLKLLKWLGIQATGTYYKGDYDLENESDLVDGVGIVDPGAADYFSFNAGVVMNVNVF